MAYLGGVYVSSEEYDKALELLQKAYKVNPEYTYTNTFLALAYAGTGDREKAMAAVDRLKRSGVTRRQIKELRESAQIKLVNIQYEDME